MLEAGEDFKEMTAIKSGIRVGLPIIFQNSHKSQTTVCSYWLKTSDEKLQILSWNK